MKTAVCRTLCIWFATTAFALLSPMAHSFTIDTSVTSTSPMSGLWDNSATESGWGAAVTQQYGMMFVTLYTYDSAGNPVWYVASNCPVTANGCTGTLYKVTGGSSPTVAWNAPNKAATPVGTLTLTFSDANTGTMTYMISGASGSKPITRNVFALAPVAPPSNVTSTITLAQLNACPNTSGTGSTGAQFWACFTGTLVGVEYQQSYACTLTIGNGQVTLATIDGNRTMSFSPVNPTYTKGPGHMPNVNALSSGYVNGSSTAASLSLMGSFNDVDFSQSVSGQSSEINCTFPMN